MQTDDGIPWSKFAAELANWSESTASSKESQKRLLNVDVVWNVDTSNEWHVWRVGDLLQYKTCDKFRPD